MTAGVRPASNGPDPPSSRPRESGAVAPEPHLAGIRPDPPFTAPHTSGATTAGARLRAEIVSLMTRGARRRREVETELEQCRAAHRRLALAAADTVGFLEALAASEAEPEVAAAAAALRERLPDAGVVLDGARGERFDPAHHRAVARHRGGSLRPGEVTQVSQHGVVCLGQRVRRARVVVSEE